MFNNSNIETLPVLPRAMNEMMRRYDKLTATIEDLKKEIEERRRTRRMKLGHVKFTSPLMEQ